MKILINRCFGGFNISGEALKLLIARGAKCVDVTPEAEYYGVEDVEEHLEIERRRFSSVYEDHDIGDGYIHRGSLGSTPIIKDGVVYDFDDDYPEHKNRSNPDLIAVAEELGEKASGFCADLEIVEIPDGVDYTIEEYDGLEHVAESHRTWS